MPFPSTSVNATRYLFQGSAERPAIRNLSSGYYCSVCDRYWLMKDTAKIPRGLCCGERVVETDALEPANENPSKKRDGDCIIPLAAKKYGKGSACNPSKKRDGHWNHQDSCKKRAKISRPSEQHVDSYAQPCSSKQVLLNSSAGRLGRRCDIPALAYIYCPKYCWHKKPDVLHRAIGNAITVASQIINLVFDNENDAKQLKLGDNYSSSFAKISMGATVTLYSKDSWEMLDCKNIDPINKCPCQMLKFSSRVLTDYQLTVVAVSMPTLPRGVRTTVLEECVREANHSEPNALVIGGFFNSGLLWFENEVAKLPLKLNMSMLEDLIILPWCATGVWECNTLDSHGPFTLFMEHVTRSTERRSSRSPASVVSISSDSDPEPVQPSSYSPSPPRTQLKPKTPLYDQFLADLETESESKDVSSLLKYIQEVCFFGDVCFIDPFGEQLSEPAPLSVKMNDLLTIVLEQRQMIATISGFAESQLSSHRATEYEMKEMWKEWQYNIRLWMKDENQKEYSRKANIRTQDAHQYRRSCFSTYCFQISGCRFLLGMLIKLPIVRIDSAERPVSCTNEAITELLDALEQHKQTPKYQQAKRTSAKRMDSQERLSKKIWWAKANLERGRSLAEHRDVGTVLWDDLDDIEQDLVRHYDSGKTKRILGDLQAQMPAVYRGTHFENFIEDSDDAGFLENLPAPSEANGSNRFKRTSNLSLELDRDEKVRRVALAAGCTNEKQPCNNHCLNCVWWKPPLDELCLDCMCNVEQRKAQARCMICGKFLCEDHTIISANAQNLRPSANILCCSKCFVEQSMAGETAAACSSDYR